MKADFFQQSFDTGTQLKLQLFRGYIREWLPVFMNPKNPSNYQRRFVNIFDFFAGCGRDSDGNPGTPLIIVNEIKQYCFKPEFQNANISLRIYYNDINKHHISKLKNDLEEIEKNIPCCQIEYSNRPFRESFESKLSTMTLPNTANLVIMDQFGVMNVTPYIVSELAKFPKTDILFFISSSFIKRFISTPEIGSKFNEISNAVKDLEYNTIHRYICDYYKQQVNDETFYLAPFSIRKRANIYGVIFGSSNLLGLEKFLNLCWKIDEDTGEANYNIDCDTSWGGQSSLFPELDKVKKLDIFEKELLDWILRISPDNISLYRFALNRGFSPSKTNKILSDLQSKGSISVFEISTGKPARKNSFYLGWNNCKTREARIRFVGRQGNEY